MLGQDAFNFSKAVSELWLAEDICDRTANQPLDQQQLLDTRQRVSRALDYVIQACIQSSLAGRLDSEIERFQDNIRTEDLKKLAGRCDHLKQRLLDELKREFYLNVARENVHHYAQRAPFGDRVARKFRGAVNEFEQAARCLAVQQPTASVFHLMRGMEVAVKSLARKLSMSISPQTTWRQLTGSMDHRIASLPEQTDREKRTKTSWGQAGINLHHVGSVIRNQTMHPASVYTQAQAKETFNAVGVFMRALCDL